MKTSSDISTRKLVIGSAAIAVLAAVIFFFAFFQVKTVEVMGNDHYSDDELKERILKSPMTSNTILAPLFYAKDAAEDFPYIENFNVRRSGRSKLIISVKEKNVVGCIPYLDSYIYFDRNGYFVEGSKTRDTKVAFFDGIQVRKVVMEEKLPIKETVMNTAIALSTIFAKNDMVPDHILFDDNYEISLLYGDITVQLGKDQYLEDKMTRAIAILPQLTGQKGILHMENISRNSKTVTFEGEEVEITAENWNGGYDENGDYTGDGEYDENGNYVINGDFSETEDLGDAENWIFMAQNGGEGTAVIENNTININTIDAGTVDYSIQLVQPDIPVEKGATYKLSFDAWADEARTGIIDVSAPTRSWGRYLKDTKFDMTTEKQTFEYEYTMTDSSDDKGRIEFNFGNQGSVAGVHIANVKLVKTNQTEIVDKKTILADGNLVYNGEFQEGTGRLGYWTVSNNCGAEYKVTGLSDGRRFSYKSLDESIDGNFVLSQDELAYAPNTKYVLKFDAETATEGKNIIITTGDSKFAVTLDKGIKNYVYKFETGEEVTDSSISIDFGNSGEVLLDNVKIMQDSLLLNGNFSADFAGYDVYIDSSADAESVVDSQKEDNAADFTIKNSGDQNWKIQLKQNNIKLEKGQWYKLSFDIKSSVSRTVQYAIQRDGSTHKDSTGAEDWTPYVQETVKLDAYDQADQKYVTVSNTFQMACDTDEESIFNIALGAGGENGSAITDQHRICIDNIVLEKTSAPEIDVPVGKNLITNSEFEMSEDGSLAGWENAVTAPGDATFEAGDGKITYSVENVGEADWNIQLKQMGLSLEQGESYTLKCTLVSDVDRVVKVAVMTPSAGYAWHGGEDVVLTAGEAKDVTLTITPKEEVFTDGITVDTGAGLFFSMGYVEGYTLGAHTVSISNVSFVKN